MADKPPTVSIGMAVYNEARFVRQGLDSLLAQEFCDFELIISDNASEDATAEICRDYASRDHRIRYYRNERNLGAVENFNYVFKLSLGEYFMWANGHTVWSPEFISSCVQVLQQDPSIMLCYPQTAWTNAQGEVLRVSPVGLDTRDCPPVPRFNLVIWKR